MKWALVIHENPDFAGIISRIVYRKLGLPKESVAIARNFADVRQPVDSYGLYDCQVMVVGFSAPSDASQSASLEGNRAAAFAFLKDIRSRRAELPFVFLLRHGDPTATEEFTQLPAVKLLGLSDIDDELPPVLGELVLKQMAGVKKPPHDVDVDITLKLGACSWGMRGAGGNPLEDAKIMAITDVQLNELVDDSVLASEAKSPAFIGRVGRKMYEILLANSISSNGLELALRQNIQIKDSSYLEAARFRFHLDSDTNQLLVETLAKPSSPHGTKDLQYWMLRSPIVRKYEGHGERQPLFKDRTSRTEPIDCLIIQGNAADFNAGPPVRQDFRAIKLATEEVISLEDYLTGKQKEFGIKSVIVMKPSAYPGKSYGEEVRKKLVERRWQLIHYAGHSTVDRDSGKGYLVLGSGQDDVMDIDSFAQNARGAQFVFLNSCSSANGTFIARLVEKNIPAVAGYAWPLADEHAFAFSKKFYEELFDGQLSKRFLEYAFMRSKAYLYNRFDQQPAWAAPLLFMQTSKTDPD